MDSAALIHYTCCLKLFSQSLCRRVQIVKKCRPLLALLSGIALVSPGVVAGAGLSTFLDEDPAQSASVAEPGAGGRERQIIFDDTAGQRLDKEMQPDSARVRSTRYGVGYEFRMDRLERVERPHRPERAHRPMRPSRPGR